LEDRADETEQVVAGGLLDRQRPLQAEARAAPDRLRLRRWDATDFRLRLPDRQLHLQPAGIAVLQRPERRPLRKRVALDPSRSAPPTNRSNSSILPRISARLLCQK